MSIWRSSYMAVSSCLAEKIRGYLCVKKDDRKRQGSRPFVVQFKYSLWKDRPFSLRQWTHFCRSSPTSASRLFFVWQKKTYLIRTHHWFDLINLCPLKKKTFFHSIPKIIAFKIFYYLYNSSVIGQKGVSSFFLNWVKAMDQPDHVTKFSER